MLANWPELAARLAKNCIPLDCKSPKGQCSCDFIIWEMGGHILWFYKHILYSLKFHAIAKL